MQTPGYPALAPYVSGHFTDSADNLSGSRTLLADRGYLRIDKCFDESLAECTYSELKEDTRYSRIEDNPADDYGVLHCNEKYLSPGVEKCCDFLKSPLFLAWLARLMGDEVRVTRQPSPFKMEFGDCIVAHDDCSDYPSNRASAVLHFSKAWKRQFGGNTVVGEVERIEIVQNKRRWLFSSKRSVIVPAFNSLMLIALRPGLAHKVTHVRVNQPRLTIVATYGLKAM